MESGRRYLLMAAVLIILGALFLWWGLSAVANPPCRSWIYLCPRGGCGTLPACPTTADYAWGAALGTAGVGLLAAGVYLDRRTTVRRPTAASAFER